MRAVASYCAVIRTESKVASVTVTSTVVRISHLRLRRSHTISVSVDSRGPSLGKALSAVSGSPRSNSGGNNCDLCAFHFESLVSTIKLLYTEIRRSGENRPPSGVFGLLPVAYTFTSKTIVNRQAKTDLGRSDSDRQLGNSGGLALAGSFLRNRPSPCGVKPSTVPPRPRLMREPELLCRCVC